jgi:hypothetical protein
MAVHILTIEERLKVIRMHQVEYRQASRTRKGAILDALEMTTQLARKTIIRHLDGPCTRTLRRRERKASYGTGVDDALRAIYRAYDHLCAERLTPNLRAYAEKLAAHGHLQPTPEVLAQLERISCATVRRHLAILTQDEFRRPRPHPPAAGLQARIPAGRIPGDIAYPGHFETDLVHHCGPQTSGEYVYTLHLRDVHTAWSELGAALGRSYRVMADAFRRIERRLPFAVREIHPDNGGEFLNHHLLRFWQERFADARISRSHVGHKNDNPFVEGANRHVVRRWMGHERLDSAAQARALNRFYDRLWLYQNFFQPVMRLQTKTRDPQSGRLRRTWDAARTPFERLLDTEALAPQARVCLTRLYDRTDPLALREELLRDLEALFALPGAQPGRTEDIFTTLELPLSIDL